MINGEAVNIQIIYPLDYYFHLKGWLHKVNWQTLPFLLYTHDITSSSSRSNSDYRFRLVTPQNIHFTCWKGMSSIVIGSRSFREPHCVISILQQLQYTHLHKQITYSKLFYMHSVYFQLIFMLHFEAFFSMPRAKQQCESMKAWTILNFKLDMMYTTVQYKGFKTRYLGHFFLTCSKQYLDYWWLILTKINY